MSDKPNDCNRCGKYMTATSKYTPTFSNGSPRAVRTVWECECGHVCETMDCILKKNR